MRTLLWTALLFCACNKQPSQPAEAVRLDAQRHLGDAITIANLTVWPVYSNQVVDLGEFNTLPDAEKAGLAEVREREVADVTTLVIENKGDVPILVCAGALVQGGKQDRQIAQDFVIEAKKTVTVDAFCVEPGRWAECSEGFRALSMQATAKVRNAGAYDRDQGLVWEKVKEDRDDAAEFAPNTRGAVTVTMSETVEVEPVLSDAVWGDDPQIPQATVGLAVTTRTVDVDAGAVETSLCDVIEVDVDGQERLVAGVRRHFDALGIAPVGFAYAINGKPITVRTFAHPRLMRAHFPAFLQAMCLEATLAREPGKVAAASAADIVALFRDASSGDEELVATEGSNTNGYRRTKRGFHGSCYLRKEARLLAVTQDWSAR